MSQGALDVIQALIWGKEKALGLAHDQHSHGSKALNFFLQPPTTAMGAASDQKISTTYSSLKFGRSGLACPRVSREARINQHTQMKKFESPKCFFFFLR